MPLWEEQVCTVSEGQLIIQRRVDVVSCKNQCIKLRSRGMVLWVFGRLQFCTNKRDQILANNTKVKLNNE